MPIYVYRCDACGREIEELQRFDDPAPITTEICPATIDSVTDAQVPCRLERVLSIAHQRWPGDYNNDGRGGWQRQGDAMVKMTMGKDSG